MFICHREMDSKRKCTDISSYFNRTPAALDSSSVDVEREFVFDQYKKFDHMPMVDSREYLRTLRAEIVSVNFSGVEQLTDAFLFTLHHCKLSLPSLRWISLAGCYYITDEGIRYLCLAFNKLTSIQLMGCKRISEKSVQILSIIPSIERIHVEGTSVGLVPSDWKMVMENDDIRDRKKEHNCVYVNGCPIISPLKPPTEKTLTVTQKKVVIVTTEDLPWSPLAVLTGQKDTSPSCKLEVYTDWKPFKDCKWTYNLFQVSKETGISELVLSPGTLVVLPYFLHPNKIGCMDNLILDLALSVTSILSKYDDCSFHLLGMSYEGEETDFTNKVTELYEGVKAKIKQWTERLQVSMMLGTHTNWRIAALNFYEQQVLAFGQRLCRAASQCYKPINGSCNIVSGHLKVGKTVNSSDLKFLDKMADVHTEQFPWLSQTFPKTLIDFSVGVARSGSCKLQSLSDFCTINTVEDLKGTTLFCKMAKLLSYSVQWGHVLFYPYLEDKPVITDFSFLSSFTFKLLQNAAPRSCDINCLGDKIPCWTRDDLKRTCGGVSENQQGFFLSLLEKLGILMKIPLGIWSNLQEVSYVYVLYKDFPEFPCVPVTTYISNNPTNSWEKEKYYFCSPGLPQSFFPNLLRHAFKLGWPAVVWKQGAIIQKGFLVVLIELIYDSEGLPVIVVQVRSEENNELHMTTFQTYTCIVDHLILKYEISVAKSVPCVQCGSSANRYQLLGDKNTRRFFLEHLVRTGEQRDVRCKTCDMGSIAKEQLGAVAPVTDLVPEHDLRGIALSTSNLFTQCLMCHNCATDGVECPFNLKQGNINWQCGCKRTAMVCDYCGMCQRCFLYIKRIVSSICPKFEAPKTARFDKDEVQALDTVKVTQKGSFLGFIEPDSEITLHNHILTPNYCPNLIITAIHYGCFHLKLEMVYSKEVVEYDGKTGSLSKGGNQVIKEDSSRVCGIGEAVHVELRYANGGFQKMMLLIHLNGLQIFSTEMDAQEVLVSLNNRDLEGTFLQIETPGRFKMDQKEGKAKKRENCGAAVASFMSSVEMKLWHMLNDIENIHFGGTGISLTGAAVVTLPHQLTNEVLKYPSIAQLKDSNYHFLCLTWNPFSGKKAQSGSKKYLLKNSRDLLTAEEPKEPKWANQLTDYEAWKLRRQIHLTDAEGVTLEQARDFVAETDRHFVTLLVTWHFIYASYPEVLLPSSTSKLLPDGVLTEETEKKVKAGLHANVKLGFWKHFSQTGLERLLKYFPTFDKRRMRHYLTAKTPFVASVMAAQEIVLKYLDKTGLNKVTSAFNSAQDLYLCDGHKNCLLNKSSMTEIKADLFGAYGTFISFINLTGNSLESLPDELFTALPNLIDIRLSMNYIANLPATVKHCKKLESIALNDNDLTDLPEELSELENLTELFVSANRFARLPKIIPKLKNIYYLTVSNLMLPELPEDFGNLTKLNTLMLQGNCLSSLPESFNKLTELAELNINGIHWVKMNKSCKVLSHDGFQHFLEGKKIDRWLDNNVEDKSDLFHMFDENGNGVLELEELGKLNAAMFSHFPRFGYKGSKAPDENTPSGFPMEVLNFTKLRILVLCYQGFTKVPSEIAQLECLQDLSLSHNPNLLSIPAEISTIKPLRKLELEDCPLLKTPPKEIRDKGLQPTLAYLKRLMDGAVLSKRTKLMLVGLGGAGKTSLVKALLSKDGKAELQQGEGITDGIDITTWQLTEGDDEITYNVWDFAGQTVYYNTHQFFLSTNRAIYFLLWNVRLGHEHAGLDFWLSSISVQAPKAPVFVIGSHVDQVNKITLPIEEIQQRYPQIAGFHFISSYTGQGIKELKKNLIDVTLQQQYMGEKIPAVWFTFENNIEKVRAKQDIVAYSQIEYIATQSGIFEKSEIFQAVQFLHDLGSVQYFSNEYLKSKVVINPQWIVDVMACVVSVKTDFIDEGRLSHAYIARIWEKYPKNLHAWLLRLTEEFDLTFPLADSPVNVVPCLLPEKKPKITWPELERGTDIKETKMIYRFDYLPAGLFNRGQVRLYNLSDDSLMWKKGSFLKKNVHIALLQQVRDNELIVTVQGPRPDNILFLVHEVFEGLIAESFHGVTYDFSLPCPQCQNMTVKDSHMFDASTIRRAIDMKAPFLQCTKYFHTISCSDLLTLLPPDSHSDFDAHLVQCVQGLKDLRKDLSADIFIACCHKDTSLDANSYIVPSRICNDLIAKGYKCWFHEPGYSKSTDDMAKALTEASIFMAFVSNSYAIEDECVNIFKYARLTLKKVILAVAIGDGFEWKQSKLGIFLADEVFVNMSKPKYDYYDNKFEELLKTLSGKTKKVVDLNPTPSCFISYSWVNSAQAVALGTKEVEGALGYGDPRELKSYLEEHGIHCWMDVERVGKNGLFADIAEGLINAKVVVVCVSDEYASSSVCKLEFRYAANTLKKPLVMAVVGTGDLWRASEVGLLSVMYPIVNFQEKTKNAKKKLLKLVQSHIDSVEDPETSKVKKDVTNEQHKNLSYQELLELAQRKLVRQLTLFAENQEMKVYPRLFVVDFMEEGSEEEKGEKDSSVTEDTKEEAESDVEIGRSNKDKCCIVEESSKQELLKQRIVARVSSGIPPPFRMHKFCVYTLCEHEEGWHSVCDPLELPGEFAMDQLDLYVAYLSRITAIMKYNKKLILKCLTDEDGEGFLKWLEESTEESQSDYQTVYHMFRELVMNTDKDNKMGNLMRCHLPNGKTIWLCQKHRDTMRVTCLSNDDQSVHITNDQDTKINNFMVTALRNLDYSIFERAFTSEGNGIRKRLFLSRRRKPKDPKTPKKPHQHRRRGQKAGTDTVPEKEEESESDAEDDPDGNLQVEEPNPVHKTADKPKIPEHLKESKTSKDTNVPTVSTEEKVKVGQRQGFRMRDRRMQKDETASVASSSSKMSVNPATAKLKEPEQIKQELRNGPKQTSRACVVS